MKKEHKHILELNDILKTIREGIASSALLEHEPHLTTEGLKGQLRTKNEEIEHLTRMVDKLKSNSVQIDVYNKVRLESSRAICENELAKTELKALQENYEQLEKLNDALRCQNGKHDKSNHDRSVVLHKENQELSDRVKTMQSTIESLENSKNQMKLSYESSIQTLIKERDKLDEKVIVLHSTAESYKNRIKVEEGRVATLGSAYKKIKDEFQLFSLKDQNVNVIEENQMLQRQISELKDIYNKHLDCVESRKRELEERLHKLEMERIDNTVKDKTSTYNEKLIQDLNKLFTNHFPENPSNLSVDYIDRKLRELQRSRNESSNTGKYEAKIKQLESMLATVTSKLHNMKRSGVGERKDCSECKELNSKTVQLNSMAIELQHYKELASENNMYQEKCHQNKILMGSLREELDTLKYKYNALERSSKLAAEAQAKGTDPCGSVTQVMRMNNDRNVELDVALKKADHIRAFFLSEVKMIRQVVGCFLGWDFHIDKSQADKISVAFKCLYSGPTSSSKVTFTGITNLWLKSILGGSTNINDDIVPIMELEGEYLDRFDQNQLLSTQSSADWYAQFMAMHCLQDYTNRVGS